MTKALFPGWYWGPNGEMKAFNSADEVPKGWVDNPNNVGKSAKKTKQVEETPLDPDEETHDL